MRKERKKRKLGMSQIRSKETDIELNHPEVIVKIYMDIKLHLAENHM